jgi:zinc protease
MRALGSVALGLALAAALPALAAAQDYTHPREMGLPAPGFRQPDPEGHRVTLPNGLVAYVVEDRTVPLVTLSAFVPGGTADAARPGAAQALERALRAGPRGMAGDAFRDALHRMAAEYGVTTSAEMVEVRLSVPAEDAWEALDLLARVLRDPEVTEAEVAAVRARAERPTLVSATATGESGPVLYEGSLALAVERFDALLLEGHAYAGAVSAALTAEDVRRHHARVFVPRNVVLAVSGDFARDRAVEALRERFGDWSGAAAPRFRPAAAAATRAPRRIHTYPADRLQAWVAIGHEIPPVGIEDEAALHVMNYILGGGHFDTRLFREGRDKRGLTNTAGGFPEPGVRGPGSYTFRTYGRPEVVPFLVEMTLREVERIRREPVSAEELEVARGALADGVHAARFANGHATARTFAREWAEHGDHRRSATYADRVRRVTERDVLAAARKYLHPDRMQVVLVGPIEAVRSGSHPEGTLRLEDVGTLVPGR